MDSQPSTADSKPPHHQSSPWTKASSAASTPRVGPIPQPEASPNHFATHHLELLPILFPQQSSLYQAQLLQYNKLISPGRGGGGGPQVSSHIPTISSPHSQTATRSRSSSKVSNKDNSTSRPGAQNCHGNKVAKIQAETADRAPIIPLEKEMSQPKMSGKKPADSGSKPLHPPGSKPLLASKSTPTGGSGNPPVLSSSVPSTPHQHARKFSFESREPSPGGAPQNHSPRSAYSETSSTLLSLRPLAQTKCKFETALAQLQRRFNYNIGTDKLERVDLDEIKNKLSEEDERRLITNMRELHKRLLPTEVREQNRRKLPQKLEKLFNGEWPGHDIRVHLFGSSGNLLCSDDSDVDICITTEWTELQAVCKIADLLDRHGMENVVCVSSARVPIVKFGRDPELGLACDMNVNNTLALENTRMVRTYVEIDDRVRPLAMIIKYWTRRRMLNNALKGSLSSYTWICMIIAFLQLRYPPILPALHQRRERQKKEDGRTSEFADDLDKLKGFGDKNRDSLATLLFQFFRFYAYEFDFDKHVLSIRLGKLLTKTEKDWHVSKSQNTNNSLCVEEPFNTDRNLGNTADETSFRGLHLELRRAFDLMAEGRLEECCEEYIPPKEEEKPKNQRLAQAPRPILVRSSSQQHSNRGGRGGYRGGGRQFNRNGNNNRRASSSVVAYDTTNPVFGQPGFQASQMTPQEAQLLWYQAQQPQLALHQDIFGSALNSLQAQENNLRFQLFTQQQALQTQQALAVAQRMQSGGGTQSTDRSRTNSFDNPPLTAPIRPDLHYIYPYALQPSPYYNSGFTTYPSSPSTTTSGTAAEFRRSLHRSTVTSESGISTGSGSLRSQSQPASRSSLPHGAPPMPGYPPSSQGPTSAPSFPARQVNGLPIPSFIPDEPNDGDYEDMTPRPASDTPPEDEGPRYVGFYVNNELSNAAQKPVNPVNTINSRNGYSNGAAPFPDGVQNTQSRRRLSTDQMPQSILDRRMRRTSRSPSPLGHNRAFSVGTNSAPLAQSPFPPTASKLGPSKGAPLVVNGTAMAPKSGPPTAGSSRQPSGSETMTSDDMASNYNNPLRINQQPGMTMPWSDLGIMQPSPPMYEPSPPVQDRPVVVRSSATTATQSPATPHTLLDSPSFNQRVAMMSTLNINAAPYTYNNGDPLTGLPRTSQNSRSRVISRQQQNGIAPLDLATGDREFMVGPDLAHLSPVYENRTPSPTFIRKFEQPFMHKPSNAGSSKSATKESRFDTFAPAAVAPKPAMYQKQNQLNKTPPVGGPSPKEGPSTASRTNGVARENGSNGYGNVHVSRSAKGEAEGTVISNASGWQKQKSRKKAGVSDLKSAANGLHETAPRNDAERKGG